MTRLDRYIIAHILGLTGIVALALLAIQTFVSFVSQIDEIGQGNFGYQDLLAYTLWLAPTGLYVMLPIIAMLGTLMGLGQLAAQSELTAMRAAGVSLLRFGRATLLGGAILGGICFVIGDYLAPHGQIAADTLIARLSNIDEVTVRPEAVHHVLDVGEVEPAVRRVRGNSRVLHEVEREQHENHRVRGGAKHVALKAAGGLIRSFHGGAGRARFVAWRGHRRHVSGRGRPARFEDEAPTPRCPRQKRPRKREPLPLGSG